jgi:hypothetical protein
MTIIREGVDISITDLRTRDWTRNTSFSLRFHVKGRRVLRA